MTVLQSPEAMIVICTVILIAYTAHVLDKAFASSEQFEAMLKARERIMGLQAENAKLRELVSGLEHCCQGFDCDCCPLYDPSGTNHRRCESLERDLGVEVDE